jgi:hypothetical protein
MHLYNCTSRLNRWKGQVHKWKCQLYIRQKALNLLDNESLFFGAYSE